MTKPELKRIHIVYFSPCGSTRETACFIGNALSGLLGLPVMESSYTFSDERSSSFSFCEDELLIWASPVYAGRLPNKTVDFVKSALNGNGTLSIPVVLYGNRNFDNALSELTGIMKDNGCIPFAAAAIPARHVFSKSLNAGRPDAADFAVLNEFCEKAALALDASDLYAKNLIVPGEEHPEKYYVPKKENGEPAVFLKAVPKLNNSKCIFCGKCSVKCPMGSIEMKSSGPSWTGICIKCQACVRSCPGGALSFDNEDFLSHVRMLEQSFSEPKPIQYWI